jgi:hypothetical protein
MNIDSVQKTRSDGARRRLLRGAFSAPAALTLYSGGAIAASSNLHCVMNQQTNPVVPLPVVTPTNETYVRIGLYLAGSDYWIRGSELNAFSLAVFAGWPSSIQFQKFDVAGNQFTGGPVNSVIGLDSSPTRWAVLRIDGAGFVVGVGNSGNAGGSAIFQSCWTSFKVGGP